MNAADENELGESRRKAKTQRERDLDDIRGVLSTKPGRRFYWSLLTECGVFKTSFVTNATIYYLEGKRAVGLKLMADLMEASPESYLLMTKEAQQ